MHETLAVGLMEVARLLRATRRRRYKETDDKKVIVVLVDVFHRMPSLLLHASKAQAKQARQARRRQFRCSTIDFAWSAAPDAPPCIPDERAGSAANPATSVHCSLNQKSLTLFSDNLSILQRKYFLPAALHGKHCCQANPIKPHSCRRRDFSNVLTNIKIKIYSCNTQPPDLLRTKQIVRSGEQSIPWTILFDIAGQIVGSRNEFIT